VRVSATAVLLALILLSPGCARRSEAPGTAPVAGTAPSWPFDRKARIVEAPKAMVVAGSSIASNVGRDILRQGGNAVDAAVAVGFAMAVVHPEAGNIGGGGFMVIRLRNG
jgi:gamma-glutamyltranspeptidase / glutathione hydrolase